MVWRDQFDYIVRDVQREYGDILSATLGGDEVDVLVVAYPVTDHDDLSDGMQMAAVIGEYRGLIDTITLVACDRAKKGSNVGLEDVRQILSICGDQAHAEKVPFRASNVEVFGDHLRVCITRVIQRREISPVEIDGFSAVATGESAEQTYSSRVEYI